MSDLRHPLFSPAHHRDDRVRLAPPLRRLPEWSLRDVGYGPLLVGERVFVSRTGGEVAAFDRATARPLWRHALPGSFVATGTEGTIAIVGERLLVYFGGELRALDLATGSLVERWATPKLHLYDASIEGDLVICDMWDGESLFGAWDLRRGALAWKVQGSPVGTAEPAVAGGIVYFWHDRDVLGAADAATGTERWRASVSEVGRHVDVLGAERRGELTGPLVVVGGQIIIPVRARHVLSLDAETGARRWLRRVEAYSPSGLTYYPDGQLYLLGDTFLERLDAATGEEVARSNVEAELQGANVFPDFGALGVTDGYVYAVGGTALIAIDVATGTLAWTFRVRAHVPQNKAPLAIDDRLYLVDGKGQLYVFAPESAP
jgi:outer membrane protein assembly factor BamB